MKNITTTTKPVAVKAKARPRNVNSPAAAADPAAPIVPPTTMAHATLPIKGTSDDTLITNIKAHIQAMTDHPTLTNPTPSQADLQATLDALVAQKAAVDTIKAQGLQATADKNAIRNTAEGMMAMRVSYVNMAAGGVADVILSAALNVRGGSTPTGELSHPLGLSVELNGVPGAMLISWQTTPGAISYLLQWADATTADRNWNSSQATTTSPLRLAGMTLGQNYAFRVCAIGGSTGQSDWSGEVVRMAA